MTYDSNHKCRGYLIHIFGVLIPRYFFLPENLRIMKTTKPRFSKGKEWQHVLLRFVSGILLFETITGLTIYLLPFSIANQVSVLLHTIIGLVFIIPFFYYMARHWSNYRSMPMTHYKFTGYLLMAVSLLLVISGVILTWQGAFQVRISNTWDILHIVGTLILIALMVPHVVLIIVRNYQARENISFIPIIKAQWKYLVVRCLDHSYRD